VNATANTEAARAEPAQDKSILGAVLPICTLIQPAARTLFWALLVLLAVQAASAAALLAFADPALAQGVDGGSVGNIEAAGTKFYDWLQSIMMLLAGIGFLIAAAWWAFAGSNDRRKSQGTSGMICALGAFAAAALVPDFLAAVADWTGAQG
jgi:hypothetical protein